MRPDDQIGRVMIARSEIGLVQPSVKGVNAMKRWWVERADALTFPHVLQALSVHRVRAVRRTTAILAHAMNLESKIDALNVFVSSIEVFTRSGQL
jgi:hypothetical protein